MRRTLYPHHAVGLEPLTWLGKWEVRSGVVGTGVHNIFPRRETLPHVCLFHRHIFEAA